MFVFRYVFLTAALFLLAFSLFVTEAEAANVSGYAWSENIGWIKMSGPGYGVDIDPNTGEFSGYAWSENVGWIKFNDLGTIFPFGPSYSARLDLTTNQVTGWARACAGASNPSLCQGGTNPNSGGWDGWIKFGGPGYSLQRTIDPVDGCALRGWSWGSDIIGWIKFGGPGVVPLYDVRTSLCPVDAELPPVDELPPNEGPISCDFSASSETLIKPANTTTLSWSCTNADSCRLTGVGSVDPVQGSAEVVVDATKTFTLSCGNRSGATFSTSVLIKVLRPVYCEIIPWAEGCQ